MMNHVRILVIDDKARLQFKVRELETKMDQKYSFDRVMGTSPSIQQALARKMAATDTTVLLTGETGTGKEVFAQAIHYAGPRKHQRFVAINCSALADFFVHSLAARIGKKIKGRHPDFDKAMQQHAWKGNIRELRNVIERCIILTDTDQLTPDLLPPGFYQSAASSLPPHSFDLSSMERVHIQRALDYTEGNKTKTAELLGIGLTTLYRKIQEYRL